MIHDECIETMRDNYDDHRGRVTAEHREARPRGAGEAEMKRWTVSLPNPDGYVIQPRDTTFYSPKEIVLAADHDAEIERLRAVMRRVANELGRENEGLVEMIREALGEIVSYQWSTATHPYPRERTWSDCEAEIERLKNDNHIWRVEHSRLCQYKKHSTKQIETKNALISNYHVEIERLRQRLIDAGISTGSDDETCSHRHPRG